VSSNLRCGLRSNRGVRIVTRFDSKSVALKDIGSISFLAEFDDIMRPIALKSHQESAGCRMNTWE
jgi:hypothetical protein